MFVKDRMLWLTGACLLVALTRPPCLVSAQKRPSPLEVSANPVEFYVGKTPSLKVSCSFKGVEGKNFTIKEIELTRNYVPIATLNGAGQAEALVEEENMEVSSELAHDGGIGSLSLSWSDPATPQRGKYRCIVDVAEKDVPYRAGVLVRRIGQSSDPNLIKQIRSEQSAMNTRLRQIRESLEQDMSVLRAELNDMKRDLESPNEPHTESGIVDCFVKPAIVKFETPYERPPVVILSIAHMDFGAAANLRLRIVLEDVTNEGFTFHCGTWADTIAHCAQIAWTSIKQ